MDDVSGLADKSDDFANFLTVSRAFNFTCVYVFHTMYPTRCSWQTILSQTKFLIFFLALFRPHLSLKYCPATVTDTLANTFRTETFG